MAGRPAEPHWRSADVLLVSWARRSRTQLLLCRELKNKKKGPPSASIAGNDSSPTHDYASHNGTAPNLRVRRRAIGPRKKSGRQSDLIAITSKVAKMWSAYELGALLILIIGAIAGTDSEPAARDFTSPRNSTELRANLRYKIRLTHDFPS
jgi:hypothetical protein